MARVTVRWFSVQDVMNVCETCVPDADPCPDPLPPAAGIVGRLPFL